MLKLFTIAQADEWRDSLEKCSEYDFYHTHDYHKLSQENGEGTALLFAYEKDGMSLCLPLLKRAITDKSDDLLGYDFTSVYGYAGPVFSKNVTDDFLKSFSDAFKDYSAAHNIISIFSRLHPTLEQGFTLSALGDVRKINKTIQIDLRQTLAEQRAHYRKSTKSEINKLRRISNVVWSDNSENDVKTFIDIYQETMDRVEAQDKYYFPQEYYEKILSAKDFDAKLLFVEHEGVKIAGALFIFCNNIIQYHLAGSKTEFMRLTPMKLLIDEIRLFGTQNNYQTFHLGGGTSSAAEDPLFRFKRGFSKVECDFSIFTAIIDKSKYDQLVEKLCPEKANSDTGSFPLYRSI